MAINVGYVQQQRLVALLVVSGIYKTWTRIKRVFEGVEIKGKSSDWQKKIGQNSLEKSIDKRSQCLVYKRDCCHETIPIY